jgi:hypothetical protein
MFYLWWRLRQEDRRRVWPLYGWYSGMMTCGSCVGVIVWMRRMMYLVETSRANQIKQTEEPAQFTSLKGLAYSFNPSYHVTYSIELMCMCAAKLMVLDRMSVFAVSEDAHMQKRWATVGQVVMAAVVLGNAVGLAANAAAAVYYQNAAQAMNTASAYYAANNTKDAANSVLLSQEEVQRAGSFVSVQRFSEVTVLLLIVVTFVVVGSLCVRRFRATLATIDEAARTSVGLARWMMMYKAAATGRALRLQMLGTTGFIFVTFLLRSVFSTMLAFAFQLRDADKVCQGGIINRCNASCHNVYTHIAQWMSYTPEFQLMIVLISSPVAQLVALWGMTTKSMLQLVNVIKRDAEMSLETMEPMEEGDLPMS